MVRCHGDLLEMVDDWRSQQRPIPSLAEAIRQLTRMGLGKVHK